MMTNTKPVVDHVVGYIRWKRVNEALDRASRNPMDGGSLVHALSWSYSLIHERVNGGKEQVRALARVYAVVKAGAEALKPNRASYPAGKVVGIDNRAATAAK